MLLSLRPSDFETQLHTGIKIQTPVGIRLPITTNQIKSKTINTNQIKKTDIYGTNFEIVSPRHILLLKPAAFTTIVTISKNLKTYEFIIHTVCPN